MKRLWMVKGVAASLAGAALLATAGDASAQLACATYTNRVVIAGSSAIQSVIAALGPIAAAQTPPLTILYDKPGSCEGLTDVTGTADTVTSWSIYGAGATASGPNSTCSNSGATAIALPLDIGVSDVYPATCAAAGQFTMPTSGFGDFTGPIQAMTFIVPGGTTGSSEHSISAEAAFAVLGYAGTGMYPVGPWTTAASPTAANVFIRAQDSGTLQMIATAIGLPGSDWKGTVEMNGGAVVSAVNTASNVDAAIGIAAAQSAQLAATPPRILAFQAKDQTCGYLPDSSSTSTDKLNVREGRYDIWGPEHFYTAVDSSGAASGNAKIITDLISLSTVGTSSQAVIAAEITAGVVPQCAMKVSRATEVGPEMSFQPTGDCSCFFDKTTTGSTTCQSCTTNADCADAGTATHCNYGYCEVQ